jgi:hypothetical protein
MGMVVDDGVTNVPLTCPMYEGTVRNVDRTGAVRMDVGEDLRLFMLLPKYEVTFSVRGEASDEIVVNSRGTEGWYVPGVLIW